MIPLLQSISQVAVPVVAEPVTLNGGGGMDFMTFTLILGVGAACAIGFMAWSKASTLAMFRDSDRERRQDRDIRDLKDEQNNRGHWLQHEVDGLKHPAPSGKSNL